VLNFTFVKQINLSPKHLSPEACKYLTTQSLIKSV